MEAGAYDTGAFQRPRAVASAVGLLRLILAYCKKGLRSTAGWASSVGLAELSDVALLNRLRKCGGWLTLLVGQTLACEALVASRGRVIRLIDGTSVPKAGAAAKKTNKLWRIHSAFELPAERFSHVELTDARPHPGGGRRDLHRRPRLHAARPHRDRVRGGRRCRDPGRLEECALA